MSKDFIWFLKNVLHWKFFHIAVNKSIHENMWCIRSFFQTLHLIGAACTEGNHRAVLAPKVLYGQKVNAPYPLEQIFGNEETIPTKSPLFYKNLEVKIMVPVEGK